MRVLRLSKDPTVYSSEVYLVLGDWNRLSDVNTLVDTGANGFILSELRTLNTGFGKKPVEQVVLTHSHFDHSGGIGPLAAAFSPNIWAYSPHDSFSKAVHDGQWLRLGDRDFQVLYTPGHSSDSICLYGPDDGILFTGDTTLNIMMPGGSYSDAYIHTLERLANLRIRTIYPGHGDGIVEGANDMIRRTLENVYRSQTFEEQSNRGRVFRKPTGTLEPASGAGRRPDSARTVG